jgi:hypothetical protein
MRIGSKKSESQAYHKSTNTARLKETAAHHGVKLLKKDMGRETPLTPPHVS